MPGEIKKKGLGAGARVLDVGAGFRDGWIKEASSANVNLRLEYEKCLVRS
jgi:hypothetical protein